MIEIIVVIWSILLTRFIHIQGWIFLAGILNLNIQVCEMFACFEPQRRIFWPTVWSLFPIVEHDAKIPDDRLIQDVTGDSDHAKPELVGTDNEGTRCSRDAGGLGPRKPPLWGRGLDAPKANRRDQKRPKPCHRIHDDGKDTPSGKCTTRY